MKFFIRHSEDWKFYFVIVARNGETIATSETYETKQACKKGIRSIKVNCIFSKTIDLT